MQQSRPIQINDSVIVSLLNSSYRETFVIRQIVNNEIFIFPTTMPNNLSKLVSINGKWRVFGAENVDYQISFIANPQMITQSTIQPRSPVKLPPLVQPIAPYIEPSLIQPSLTRPSLIQPSIQLVPTVEGGYLKIRSARTADEIPILFIHSNNELFNTPLNNSLYPRAETMTADFQ